MTFTEIVTEISERLNLYKPATITRIGREVNQRYQRVTGDLGIVTSRRAVKTATATLGVRYLEFTATEKILSVFDTSDNGMRVLDEITFDEMRQIVPTEGTPQKYAIASMTADSVTILLDCTPQDEFVLNADVIETAATLSGSMEPAIPQSFHDILIHGGMSDELRKKGEYEDADTAEKEFEKRYEKLKHHLAASAYLRLQQNKNGSRSSSGTVSGGGGTGSTGGASVVQTGLITYDRDPDAPFAVTSGSAVVPNLDADMVDGYHAVDIVALAGDCDGPASSTDNAIARFDGTGGKTLQNSGITIADGASGTLAGSNSGDVTLAGSPNYLTIAAQVITRALIDLASHITGRLPFANLVAATAASKLIGRQSGSAGDFGEITLGTGLSMSGSTLNASAQSKPLMPWTAQGNQPPASAYATPDTRNSHPVLDFDGATDEEAVFGGVLSPDYAGGGLTCETYWAFTSATSGSLRVQAAIERIDVSSLDIDADSFASFQSAGGTAPGTSGQVIKVTITFTSGAQMDSLAAGEAFRLKIRRDADGTSGTDDIVTDAELLRVVLRET